MIARTGFPEYLETIAIGPNAEFLKNNTDLCHVANQFSTEVNLTYMWKQVERSRDTLAATRQFVKNFMLDAPDLDTEFLMHYTKKIDNINPQVRDTIKFETREALKKAVTITNHVVTTATTTNNVTTTATTSATTTMGAAVTTSSAPGRNFDATKPIHEDSSFLSKLSNLMDACDSPCDYFAPVTDKIGSLIDYSRHNSMGNAAVGDLDGHTPPPMGIGLNVLNKIPSAIQATIAKAFTSAKIAIDTAMTSLTNPTGKINFSELAQNSVTPDQQGLTFPGATNSSMFHDIMGMHTNMRAKIKGQMQDCYRSAEFATRYNPFNPEMNMAVAQEKYFDVVLKSATGERPYTVNASGFAKGVYENNQTSRDALKPTTSREAMMYDDMIVAPRPKPRVPTTPPSLQGTSTSRDTTGNRSFKTNDASAAIVRAAKRNIGRDTSSIPGTQQGNVACAASVNIMVTEALGYPAGGGHATAMMYPALKNNNTQWTMVDAQAAVPGSIIISPTDHGKTGHVGIIIDTSGNIVSNSSSKRQILQNFNISSWKNYYENKQGLKTYAFTHVGEVNTSVQESLTASPSHLPPTGISDQLVDFVSGQEGFTAQATWDYHQWSNGYGTVAKYPGEVINKTEAKLRLQNELEVHAGRIDSAAKNAGLQLTAGQRDALISYDYNTGRGASIIKSVNGDPNKLSSAIANGVKTAGGKTLTGLAQRRSAESRLASS
jgi:GH24 family phage-related lysozyme (muramidase)